MDKMRSKVRRDFRVGVWGCNGQQLPCNARDCASACWAWAELHGFVGVLPVEDLVAVTWLFGVLRTVERDMLIVENHW